MEDDLPAFSKSKKQKKFFTAQKSEEAERNKETAAICFCSSFLEQWPTGGKVPAQTKCRVCLCPVEEDDSRNPPTWCAAPPCCQGEEGPPRAFLHVGCRKEYLNGKSPSDRWQCPFCGNSTMSVDDWLKNRKAWAAYAKCVKAGADVKQAKRASFLRGSTCCSCIFAEESE